MECMDPSLQKILIGFSLFTLAGGVPLWWASISTSRLERLFTGLFLVAWAAFLLSGVGLVTFMGESMLSNGTASVAAQEQLKDFMPYLFFFGSLYTFAFGGVGTNILTSALSVSESVDISDTVRRIERQVAQNQESLDELSAAQWHIPQLIGSIVLLLLLVGLLAFAWPS